MKKFGLSSSERIKSRNDFKKIFNTGKALLSSDKRIKALYVIEKSEKPGVKIAVAVYKKLGSAVWRNRVKRLIKTAYRLNKEILLSLSSKKNILIKIIFSPVNISQKNFSKIRLDDVMPGINEIILKFKSFV